MRIVVVGNLGMLGRDLQPGLERAGYLVRGFDLPELDIRKPREVLDCLKEARPGAVVNCAAYTDVDRAESEPGIAFAVNRDGPANLAEACRTLGIPLVHLSTDYVFDGRAGRAYREDDPANPINVYGRSKWDGEEAVRSRLDRHIILRTSWLFGSHGRNFVKTMLELAREKKEIRVVADQHGCPTWTGHLEEAIRVLIDRIRAGSPGFSWGTYHFCGRGSTTWYGFAKAIVAGSRAWEGSAGPRVVPVTTEEYPTPARRPMRSILDCSKIGEVFGIAARPWREGLREVLRELGVVAGRGSFL
ncbi:MAG: dTDP-4-dehydrorhamnose reductase [Deltaproteobacteria bacterium]|nr:dTDP-4-dehydrorhamnose reductase [Deltaproteobacteria bacterium]